jgi:nitrogen-specific signal transduction histidine kinase
MKQLELRVNVGLLEQQTRWLKASRSEIQRKQRELDASRVEQLELKDQLLRHVSHELRTPLSALHQFLSLLRDDVGDTSEQREFLDLAFKSSQQLKRMISDLLEVARAESGKLRIDTHLLALAPLVHDVVESSRECAAAAGLSIMDETPPDLPIVLADAERTRQVLDNLVANAMKFTPEPGSIRLGARIDEDDPEFVRCSVTDSGCGIAEESQASIFEQFHQESNQHTSSREGLGVGLAICRSLVTRMGGRIWVESKLGAGSSFHFTIPVFELETMIRRALSSDATEAAADSVSARPETERNLALVRVSFARPDGSAPTLAESQQRLVRHLIEGLLYYHSTDQLLPKLGNEGRPDSPHVIVATDAAGLRALVRRLEEHLNLDSEIRLWKLRAHVEGVAVRAPAASTEIKQIAAEIEALIQTNIWKEGIRNEQVQGDDRR